MSRVIFSPFSSVVAGSTRPVYFKDDITIEAGILSGIGTADIYVDNTNVVLNGLLADIPTLGSFIGQVFSATDTGQVFVWDGTMWVVSSDITSSSIREIIPDFAVIEIREYQAGNVGNRNSANFVRRGNTTIDGGTWSLTRVLLSGGTATINSTTGLVTLSDINSSGSYTLTYTHTDGVITSKVQNVSYILADAGARGINATPPTASWFDTVDTSKVITHRAFEGPTDLTGGTWSVSSITSGITLSINSSTGAVTITDAGNNGTYTVKYTHTDTTETSLVVDVVFYPPGDPWTPPNPEYDIEP